MHLDDHAGVIVLGAVDLLAFLTCVGGLCWAAVRDGWDRPRAV